MKSIFEFLNEAVKTDTISVFDVDDTLLFSQNEIGIIEPGKDIYWVSTDSFAKIRTGLPNNTEFDFSGFSDYEKSFKGIINGKPNLKVLQVLSDAIQKGHKIGILTARANQSAVYESLRHFLTFTDVNGKNNPLPEGQFNKKFVFAIGDENVKSFFKSGVEGDSSNPSKLKAYILQKIFGDKMGFQKIFFYDDDEQNIKSINDLNDSRITSELIKND